MICTPTFKHPVRHTVEDAVHDPGVGDLESVGYGQVHVSPVENVVFLDEHLQYNKYMSGLLVEIVRHWWLKVGFQFHVLLF